MSSRADRVESRRRSERRLTEWAASCRVDGAILVGVILDISSHGVFFAPTGGEESPIVTLASSMAVDQRVGLSFVDDHLTGLELPGRVRWIGFSPTHRRVGMGVEFSHRPLG